MYYDIGDPIQFYFGDNISKYKINGHESYLRNFTNGIVIVNPSTNKDSKIQLGKTYYDGYNNGNAVNTVTPNKQSGYMLLGSKPSV